MVLTKAQQHAGATVAVQVVPSDPFCGAAAAPFDKTVAVSHDFRPGGD